MNDYLSLIAIRRTSVQYARPSDADNALTGLAGICFVASFLLVFVIAFLAHYLGEPMNGKMLTWPIVATFLPGVAYFFLSISIGSAPRLTRYGFVTAGMIVVMILSYLALTGGLNGWYLYIPPFLFALLVSLGAIRQL